LGLGDGVQFACSTSVGCTPNRVMFGLSTAFVVSAAAGESTSYALGGSMGLFTLISSRWPVSPFVKLVRRSLLQMFLAIFLLWAATGFPLIPAIPVLLPPCCKPQMCSVLRHSPVTRSSRVRYSDSQFSQICRSTQTSLPVRSLDHGFILGRSERASSIAIPRRHFHDGHGYRFRGVCRSR
jgi:hypothetical protein